MTEQTKIGRPTYHIVKLDVKGNCFMGDATKCFKGQLSREENFRLAEIYWKNSVDTDNQQAICEMLVNGEIYCKATLRQVTRRGYGIFSAEGF